MPASKESTERVPATEAGGESASSFLDAAPPFCSDLHVQYIANLAVKLDKPSSYEGAVTEHLRMSGVYWSLAALSLLRPVDEADKLLGITGVTTGSTSRASSTEAGEAAAADGEANPSVDAEIAAHRKPIVDWVFDCYDGARGGFGGNVGHDAHLLYTLSALQILAMADKLDDPRLDRRAVVSFVSGLQQTDGSFAGDEWGEVDTRFSYCALSALSILGALPHEDSNNSGGGEGTCTDTATIDLQKAALYVSSCRNFDGGFGSVPGAESHAGQIFCCVAALSIARSLHLLDSDLLSWWLAERQCDSGGLNGRPEKQADVCYSWWILSALSILGRTDWINSEKLASFILRCQDDEDGGIADRPNDMADVFHTFFGIAGLSLLGVLDEIGEEQGKTYRLIDPVFALPVDVVAHLGLQAQVVRDDTGDIRPWLANYDV